MILDLKQEIEQLTKEKNILSDYLATEQRKLKEHLRYYKSRLKDVNNNLQDLQQQYEQQQWKEWLFIVITIQDLYNRVNELKAANSETAYSGVLHVTPLDQSNESFYVLPNDEKVLRDTYTLTIDITNNEVIICNLYKLGANHPFMRPQCIACYYHSLDLTTEQNEKALYDVFAKYVELRNKYVVPEKLKIMIHNK